MTAPVNLDDIYGDDDGVDLDAIYDTSVTGKVVKQIKGAGSDIAHAVMNPWETAKGIVTGAIDDAKTTFKPVIGERPGEGAMLSYKDRLDLKRQLSGREVPVTTLENTPDAVTPEASNLAALNTVANTAMMGAPFLGFAVRAPINTALGAASNPEEPIRGGLNALAFGEAFVGAGKAVGATGRAAKRAVSRATDVSGDMVESGVQGLGDDVADAEMAGVGARLAAKAQNQEAMRKRLAEQLQVTKIGKIGRRPAQPQPESPPVEVVPEPPPAPSRPVNLDEIYADEGGRVVSAGPPPADIQPVASANGSFEARPGVMRKVNQQVQQPKAASPLPPPPKGLDKTAFTVDPNEINQRQWYHGTGTEGLTPEGLSSGMTKADNLLGPGLYVTSDPDIAMTYAAKRGRRAGKPTLYGAKVNVRNVLDMDSPAPENVKLALVYAADNVDLAYETEIAERVRQAARNPNATGADVWRAMAEGIEYASHDLGLPSYEFLEPLQRLTDQLREMGFDAMTYRGGVRTGGTPHQAMVLFSEPGGDRIANVTHFAPEAPKVEPAPVASASPVPEIKPTSATGKGRKQDGLKMLFPEARMPSGSHRPFESVSSDGLLRELIAYEPMYEDAIKRSQYRSGENDMGNQQYFIPQYGKDGVTTQSKALQNLKDYDRITEAITQELKARGFDDETIGAKLEDLRELQRAIEREQGAWEARNDPLVTESLDAVDGRGQPHELLPDDQWFEGLTDEPELSEKRIHFSDSGTLEQDLVSPERLAELMPRLTDEDAKVRIDKLTADPTGQSELDATLARMGGVRQTRSSFSEMLDVAKQVADQVGLDPSIIDPKKIAKGKLSGAQIVGLGEVVNRNLDLIQTASRELQRGDLSADAIERYHLILDGARQQNELLLDRIMTEKSAKGRDLAFLKQVAQRSLDPATWLVQAKKMLGDTPLTDEMSANITRLAREAFYACGGK